MGIRERLSGNEAVAYAMKQINPDVMGAYPITPSTEIPQYFSTYVDNGEVDTLFIAVESEHSAMSTCIGAEAAGCRAISATSSCGLCYMTEMLYVAASDRLPITLAVSCRALSGPININNDHSDAMGVRDAGWLMLFAETNQEAYDNYLQAMRIAEAVSLPIMVCQDGFITSHAIENIELVETEKVKEFVGEYKPAHALLKPGEPMAVGAYATPVYYMEAKRQQAQAMMDAKDVIRKVGKEFGEMTGRTYGLIETYMMDDAEEAIVIIGSSAGTAKEAINELRAQGKKVGQIKVRSFRPFPSEDICEALKNVKAFAVMDKDDSFNAHCGPMFAEVTASLYAAGISGPKGINYIYGLGGRDVRVESIQHVFAELEKIAATGETGETYRYLDVRDELGLDLPLEPELEALKKRIDAKEVTQEELVSRGEYFSAKLMAAYLGFQFVDAADWVMFNMDGTVNREVSYKALRNQVLLGYGAVIPGFYGAMPDGAIHTFSRGGSDITGALAAAALDADVYENWTDVSGILMADPRIVDDPQAIPEVTYDELRELSYSGAQVLHEDSIFPVREKNIPVNIRNTNDPDAPGTMIQESFSGDVDPDRFITGITGKKDFSIISLTKRGMSNQVGVLRRVLSVLERHNISVDYVPNGIDNVSVVLPTAAVEKELYTIMAEIKKEAQPDTLDVHHHIAVVAAVGRKMAFRPGISGRIFKALGESGINIRMINQGPDELNIIFGVDNKDFKEAIRVLYNSFVK